MDNKCCCSCKHEHEYPKVAPFARKFTVTFVDTQSHIDSETYAFFIKDSIIKRWGHIWSSSVQVFPK